MDQALRPEPPILPTLDAEPIQEIEAQVVDVSLQDDKELAALNMSRGWNRIANAMKTDVEKLRYMSASDLQGLSITDVGQKFLVASATADILQRYLDMVDNATKAVVEHETKRTWR